MDLKVGSYGINPSRANQSQRTPKNSATSFNNKLKEVKASQAQGDSITITGSFAKRLEKLKAESEKMDYTGMTDAEIYKSIHDRYEKEFPRNSIMQPFDQDNYNMVLDQLNEELKAQFPSSSNGEYKALFKTAMEYDGMSKEDITSAILQKHSGNSPLDKLAAINEMYRAGVMSNSLYMSLSNDIERNLAKDACEKRGVDYVKQGMYEKPIAMLWALEYAQGTTTSWTNVLDDFSKSESIWPKELAGFIKEFEDIFYDTLLNEKKGEKL